MNRSNIFLTSFFQIFILYFICFSNSTINSLSAQDVLVKKDTNEIRFLNSRKFYIYKVGKSETLFSISKKFNIPQEEIRQFNPDLEKSGLQAKMKLWIPAYSWLKKDGQKPEKEIIEEVPPRNAKYSVTLITCLNLSRIYMGKDTTDSSFVNEMINPEISANLHFVEGALKAADDLKAMGLKMHLTILDSENDSAKVSKLLSKSSLNTQDMIISNENGPVLNKLARFSKNQSVRMLSGNFNTTDQLKGDALAISLFPSSLSQCRNAGKIMKSISVNSNCILVKTGSGKENERAEMFRTGWKESGNPGRIIPVNFKKENAKAVTDSLVKGQKNIIFIPTSNEEFVSTLLNTIKEVAIEYQVMVIGLPTWQYFETIDPDIFTVCNVRLFSAGFIDRKNFKIDSFRKFFRSTYNTDPMESAFIGYDAMFVVGEHFLRYGNKFNDEKKEMVNDGLYSSYRFSEVEEGQCQENSIIHMIRFEDYLPVCFFENK